MKKFMIIAVVMGFSAQPALARETGWITVNEWFKASKTLKKKNDEMPVSMMCRDSGRRSNRNSILVNARIEKNPEQISWHWATSPYYGRVKNKLEKKGYNLAAHSSYRRKSGLVVNCGLWFRSKSK